ncbi:hypothetical protein [Flavobacterium sp.]|uniref:hypothetical protein n=1 Tax=Flavobacterium sp. TaxID=239 RepID=UPI004048BAD0
MKKKHLILCVISVLLFVFFRLIYRPYIYGNSLYDFYIADTAPNFFSLFAFVFYKKYKEDNNSTLVLCLGALLGLIIYEVFIQEHVYNAVLDWKDIFASFLASVLAFCICNKIEMGKFFLWNRMKD